MARKSNTDRQKERQEARERILTRRKQHREYLGQTIENYRKAAGSLKAQRDEMARGDEVLPFEHAQQLAERAHVAAHSVPKQIDGRFRQGMVPTPPEINQAPGISVFGRVIRSFIYTTDVVAIRNSNADAVLAVYPFTCQPAITQALLISSECPVFTGVAGAVTKGERSVDLALQSEMQGVTGVVANNTAEAETISMIAARVDIPLVVTITTFNDYERNRIEAGASIVNVAAGARTTEVVAEVREAYPDLPIMASGGKSGESILETIAAGADAITYTPPSLTQIQKNLMAGNREAAAKNDEEADGLVG
jgi:hypothetical protein